MGFEDAEVTPQLAPTYGDETKDLILGITEITDRGSFPTPGESLTRIRKARADALNRLRDMGPGQHVKDITDRLNLLNGLQAGILRAHPEVKRIHREPQEPPQRDRR